MKCPGAGVQLVSIPRGEVGVPRGAGALREQGGVLRSAGRSHQRRGVPGCTGRSPWMCREEPPWEREDFSGVQGGAPREERGVPGCLGRSPQGSRKEPPGCREDSSSWILQDARSPQGSREELQDFRVFQNTNSRVDIQGTGHSSVHLGHAHPPAGSVLTQLCPSSLQHRCSN